MKAQRRHDLKTNALANQIIGLPDYWRLYGGKVLLGLCAVLAVVLFFKYQHGQTLARQQRVSDAYGMALADYSQLRALGGISDQKFANEQRRQLQDRIDAQIREVLDETKDDAMRADALVLRGDLNWSLATSATPRGATTTASTQSTSRPTADTRDDYLDGAKRAYEAAMTTPSASVLAICKSRLGLGAIAEQHGEWDAAKKQYEAMVSDTATPAPFRDEARLRIDELSRIQKPPLLGKPATLPAASTQPAESDLQAGPLGPERPATTRASTTRPTTQPSKPNAAKK